MSAKPRFPARSGQKKGAFFALDRQEIGGFGEGSRTGRSGSPIWPDLGGFWGAKIRRIRPESAGSAPVPRRDGQGRRSGRSGSIFGAQKSRPDRARSRPRRVPRADPPPGPKFCGAARIFSPPAPKKSGHRARSSDFFSPDSEKIGALRKKISRVLRKNPRLLQNFGTRPGSLGNFARVSPIFSAHAKIFVGGAEKVRRVEDFFCAAQKKLLDPRTFSWHPQQKNSRRQKNFRRVQKNSAALPIFFVTSGKKFRCPTIFARRKNFFCRTQNFFRR